MQEPELKENPRKNLEILVVDGDPVTRLLHQSRLQKHFEYPVINCIDGKEAIVQLQKNSGSDYLVLLAIDMDGMNGWEFLEVIQTMPFKTQIHVIMVTCSVSSSDKRIAMNFPQVLDYFEKPFSEDHIRRIPHLPRLIPYFVSAN